MARQRERRHDSGCNLQPYHGGKCGVQCGSSLEGRHRSGSWAAYNQTCRRRAVISHDGMMSCRQHALLMGWKPTALMPHSVEGRNG